MTLITNSLSCRCIVGPLRNPVEASLALKLDTEWKTISRTAIRDISIAQFYNK